MECHLRDACSACSDVCLKGIKWLENDMLSHAQKISHIIQICYMHDLKAAKAKVEKLQKPKQTGPIYICNSLASRSRTCSELSSSSPAGEQRARFLSLFFLFSRLLVGPTLRDHTELTWR